MGMDASGDEQGPYCLRYAVVIALVGLQVTKTAKILPNCVTSQAFVKFRKRPEIRLKSAILLCLGCFGMLVAY